MDLPAGYESLVCAVLEIDMVDMYRLDGLIDASPEVREASPIASQANEAPTPPRRRKRRIDADY